MLEKYWERGYRDYFSFGYNKELVKGSDGKWSLKDPDDIVSQAARRLASSIAKTPSENGIDGGK